MRNKIGISLWIISIVTIFVSCSSKQSDSSNAENLGKSSQRFQLVVNDSEKKVDILCAGELFTSYIYPESTKKPVLFPIHTAGGIRITRAFPFLEASGERVDHPHQVGMWLNYGNVNGLDFWNNSDSVRADRRDRYGEIFHKDVLEATGGNDNGILKVSADWKTPDGTILLEEITEYIFSGTANERIIDRSTTLKAVNGDVDFTDNKEGFFAIRVTRALEHPSDKPEVFTDASGKSTGIPVLNNEGVTGRYYNSEGVEGTDCWGKRAKWVNLYGNIDGEGINLIMLDHPDNVGYPTYWHARGYGLFSANPLGQEPLSNGKDILNFKLADKESVTFKYRVIIHSGERLEKNIIDKRFEEFSASN